jgi:hypothetical protein
MLRFDIRKTAAVVMATGTVMAGAALLHAPLSVGAVSHSNNAGDV